MNANKNLLVQSQNLVLAIDNGKMNMKGKYGLRDEDEICYLNRYSEGHTDDQSLLGKNTWHVTYGNLKYTIGANADYSDREEGKSSEPHIIQALTAITRMIKPDEKRDICLIYGESVDMYFRTGHKEEIKRLLERTHVITVNGETYTFTIKVAHVLPEGIGFIFAGEKPLLGMQYICDIGGGTINWITVNNGRPIKDKSRSYMLGVNDIVNNCSITSKRSDKLKPLDEELIFEYLNYRENCKNQELLNTLDTLMDNQLKQLDISLAKDGVNIKNILESHNVYFIGGGSTLLKEHIDKHYNVNMCTADSPRAIVVEDALKANVRGFYTFGVVKYGA